jgi:hypothetical protein
MNRIIEAKADRALTEQELNAVSGGTIQIPISHPKLINKPVIPPVGIGSKSA